MVHVLIVEDSAISRELFERTLVHSLNRRQQRQADLFQPVDHIIRNVQRGTADGAGGQRDALIGDLVTPIVQCQQIGLGNLHGNTPFLFSGKKHYLIKGVPNNGLGIFWEHFFTIIKSHFSCGNSRNPPRSTGLRRISK